MWEIRTAAATCVSVKVSLEYKQFENLIHKQLLNNFIYFHSFFSIITFIIVIDVRLQFSCLSSAEDGTAEPYH